MSEGGSEGDGGGRREPCRPLAYPAQPRPPRQRRRRGQGPLRHRRHHRLRHRHPPLSAASLSGRREPGEHFSPDFRSVCGFTCQAFKMMSMNSKQPHFAMHPTLPEHKYPSLHSSSEAIRRACLPTPPVRDRQLQLSSFFLSLTHTHTLFFLSLSLSFLYTACMCMCINKKTAARHILTSGA